MRFLLSLPKSTELSKQLPKKAIYEKFNMSPQAKDKFDSDVSRMYIVAEISPNTINIDKGETVPVIFAVQIILKRKNFDPKTISQISKLIDQKMLLVLDCDGERKLAIHHSKLIHSEWKSVDDCTVSLTGLNLDTVWENLITQVGSIEIEQGHTLDEQIESDEQKAKLQKEMARLEKLAKKEKQPKKKFEIVQKIKALQKEKYK